MLKLTREDKLARVAQARIDVPSAFRMPEDGAAHGVSKHYKFMTTSEIIDGLSDMGWYIESGKQQKSKEKGDTTRHMLRFRHDDYTPEDISENVKNYNIPEIILVNSHDRTSSLNFHVGVFRTVCSNGLIVASQTFSKLTVRHMGTEFDEVRALINDITENLPSVFKIIQRFQNVNLSQEQQIEFAAKSLAIRFPEYINPRTNKIDLSKLNQSIDVSTILESKRIEDNGDALWAVYNRVQEKIIKGGFQRIGDTGKAKAVRELTNIRMGVIVNKGLWSLAENYV
jgi:hypothetical protein